MAESSGKSQHCFTHTLRSGPNHVWHLERLHFMCKLLAILDYPRKNLTGTNTLAFGTNAHRRVSYRPYSQMIDKPEPVLAYFSRA